MGLVEEEGRSLDKAGITEETPFGEGNLGQPLSSVSFPIIRDPYVQPGFFFFYFLGQNNPSESA